jgi:hypothetical protein
VAAIEAVAGQTAEKGHDGHFQRIITLAAIEVVPGKV